MKFSKLLPLPKGHRRRRSKARSKIGSIEGQSEPNTVAPHPTKSTPDLRVGTSTSPTSSPLTPRDQVSNGMQTTLFRTIDLSNHTFSRNTGRPSFSDRFRFIFSDWKSTAYSTTKLAIILVKESLHALPPPQICYGVSFGHPESLRSTVHLSQTMPPMIFTAVVANNGVSSDDTIVDTPSRTVSGVVGCARSRGRGQGRREEDDPQTVTHLLQG